MCDLKPGDEVVRYRMGPAGPHPLSITPDPEIGHVGIVTAVGETVCGGFWIELDNWPADPLCGLPAEHFRKVQRRDLTAWLATKNTIDDPNPVPAKEVS